MKNFIVSLLLFFSSFSYGGENEKWRDIQDSVLSEINSGDIQQAWCTAWPLVKSKDPEALIDITAGVMNSFIYPYNYPEDKLSHLRLSFVLSFRVLAESEDYNLDSEYVDFVRHVLNSELIKSDAMQTRACLNDYNPSYSDCLDIALEARLVPSWGQFTSSLDSYCPSTPEIN